jgi:hypothetical protein
MRTRPGGGTRLTREPQRRRIGTRAGGHGGSGDGELGGLVAGDAAGAGVGTQVARALQPQLPRPRLLDEISTSVSSM